MSTMYEILNKFKSVAGSQQLNEGKKPDFLDIDKDGDKKEPMKKAAKEKKVDESVEEASTGDYSAKKARAGKDIGKPGKAFAKIAKSAGEKYGSKERGEKVAGAVLAKLRGKRESIEESHDPEVAQVLKNFSGDIKNFRSGGDLSDDLYSALFNLWAKEMPYGTAKARTGDPYQWIAQRLEQELGEGVDKQAFAALAPPKDKITFADKIAGAKKEVDEMLGDVAAEAMRNALGKGKKVVADEGWDDMMRDVKSRGDAMRTGEKRKTHKGELEKTATGVIHRRSYDPSTGETPDDGSEAGAAKKGRGRPKGTGKSIGAKGPSGKSKLLAKEGADYGQAQQIYDELADLRAVAKQAQGGGQFPQGFASRLEAILYAAMTLIKNQQPGNAQVREDDLEEKAVSKKQQKFMGMVHAAQKGEKPASKEVAKVAKTMKKKDAEDFASTKHKGLPEKKKPEGKKKEESVEENTVAGSVAPSSAAPAKDLGAPKKEKASKGSMQFGKGVYEAKLAESFNNKLTTVLSEGISISANQSEDGKQTLTVNATDEDALKLAQLLQLAGMPQSQGYEEACADCGQSPCGCDHEEVVDEEYSNSPDAQVSDTDTMVNKLSGGLNGRKTTGQTTVPVVNRDPRRGAVGPMAEGAESKMWELYNRYSVK